MGPTIICYTALISACEEDGQWQWQPALALRSETLGARLEPTFIC